MGDGAEKANEEIEQLKGNLLSIDKFEALPTPTTTADGEDTDYSGMTDFSDAINDAVADLNALEGQIAEINKIIKDFFEIPGMLELTRAAVVTLTVALGLLLIKVGAIMALSIKAKIVSLVGSMGMMNGTISLGSVALVQYQKGLLTVATNAGIAQVSILKLTAGVSLLAFSVMGLINSWKDITDNWEDMSGGEKVIAVLSMMAQSLGVVIGLVLIAKSGFFDLAKLMIVEVFASIKKVAASMATVLVPALKSVASAMYGVMASVTGIVVSIGLLVTAIGYMITNWDKLSNSSKVLIPVLAVLAAALTGVAVARAAAEAGLAAPVMAGVTAAAIAAAIVVAAGTAISIQYMEKGGVPERGSLFIANEAGPELIGNFGGVSAVANNEMIVSAIEQAAFRGISAAMLNNKSSEGRITIDGSRLNDNALARAILPALKLEIKRQGGKL
jgi:hypothetical protein